MISIPSVTSPPHAQRVDGSSVAVAGAKEDETPFELSCEGQPLDAFPTLERARRAAEAAADLTDCPHEIWHTPTRTLVATIDPPAAA